MTYHCPSAQNISALCLRKGRGLVYPKDQGAGCSVAFARIGDQSSRGLSTQNSKPQTPPKLAWNANGPVKITTFFERRRAELFKFLAILRGVLYESSPTSPPKKVGAALPSNAVQGLVVWECWGNTGTMEKEMETTIL